MKVSEQCGVAASKGNQIRGLIRRNITYKKKEIIIHLYNTVVKPHLEYCIEAWRPYRKKDIDFEATCYHCIGTSCNNCSPNNVRGGALGDGSPRRVNALFHL